MAATIAAHQSAGTPPKQPASPPRASSSTPRIRNARTHLDLQCALVYGWFSPYEMIRQKQMKWMAERGCYENPPPKDGLVAVYTTAFVPGEARNTHAAPSEAGGFFESPAKSETPKEKVKPEQK